ncbi:hypothetical protein [Endozoicomonas arenosclerae]|uniref:hypothetical protein n=1 Tax=Endozoicomonas arenosclerae TaxID=1633495 RepID=UPI000781E30F|nr:hypothetical protein [Endozoicomonas arenosclerae]
MQFVCVGFDVRVWPWNGPFNVDDTGWEQSDRIYENLKLDLNLDENEYQLLKVDSETLLHRVSDYINKSSECDLVAIELPVEIVKLYDAQHGYMSSQTKLDLAQFKSLGFDVCDFNGFFSILHNSYFSERSGKLFSNSSLLSALECSQVANVIDPQHSPFVVARVSSLKSCNILG